MILKNDLISFLEEKVDRTIEAVYLSGSEINHLNVKRTNDRGLFVFVQDSRTDVINNRMFSKQMMLDFDNQTYDIKIYDLRKLYSLIKKSNFNILEVFGKHPLYRQEDNFTRVLANKDNWGQLACFNLGSLINSLIGITASALKRIERKGINNKESIKGLVQAIKCQEYLKDVVTFVNGKTSYPLKLNVADLSVTDDITLKELKESAYDSHLNEDDLYECLVALREKIDTNKEFSNVLLTKEQADAQVEFQNELERALATRLSISLLR